MNYRRTLIAALGLLLSVIDTAATATPESDFWRWFRQNEPVLFDFERDQERTFDRLAEQMHKVIRA